MKAVVLAYHNIGCIGIRALLKHGFDISAVFTYRDDPRENIWFESVAELAAAQKIPAFVPDDINHPLWVEKIREMKPDILFSFYYRDMVKSTLLGIPPKGCLNLHGSLLPKYRGRCPVNWALINGEKESGVTLHYMTPKPDDGDIVCQEKVGISKEDTARSLYGKLSAAAEKMLDDILPRVRAGTAPRIPQDHNIATCFGGRRPEDGEIDWKQSASQIRNLIRAVTLPYPGAFTYTGGRKCLFWQAEEISSEQDTSAPGTVLSTDPLTVSCGLGKLRIDFAQPEDSIYMDGARMAQELSLVPGSVFGPRPEIKAQAKQKKSVLILGVDGFIGNALSERLLESGKYEVHGMDLHAGYVHRLLSNPDFHFHEGDIAIHREWIEYHVRKCDVIIPLVAIATPIEYTRNPLRVFELDFEENLKVVRYCVKYRKRLIFPSTSEVYGMSTDEKFDEDRSNLVLGPINKQRWIYSCCKQMLDRVIWAYGQQEGLEFTLFRPFNWIGPRLDSLSSARIGSSRAITQLILNLVEGTPIRLMDGGEQKRCFTDLSDGIECLYRIIENKDRRCNGQIINIGNPDNEASIRELARILVEKFQQHPLRPKFPPFAGIREVESHSYYGAGYQDVQHRKPCIRNARGLVGWTPLVSLEQSVKQTLDYFMREAVRCGEFEVMSDECRLAN
ncbi:MAG: bifunctional UDP-4-amino-4-deoxy-L-arabinose formyltransferase/UDP-glucuronic acid oxidase ArnA [Desulfococcaceae bacterium]